MEVFISWSGEKSRRVANVLRDWLPRVVQTIEPWLGPSDTESVTDWRPYLQDMLRSSDAGIICITKSNQRNAGLKFEAEALISAAGPERAIPLIVDLRPDELDPSLAFVDYVEMDKAGISRLFQRPATLAGLDRPAEISEQRLEEIMAALIVALTYSTVANNFYGLVDASASVLGISDSPRVDTSQSLGVDPAQLEAMERKLDAVVAP